LAITGNNVIWWRTHNTWIGLGPEESPLFLRDFGIDEAYEIEIGYR